jgi:hypothetical protein
LLTDFSLPEGQYPYRKCQDEARENTPVRPLLITLALFRILTKHQKMVFHEQKEDVRQQSGLCDQHYEGLDHPWKPETSSKIKYLTSSLLLSNRDRLRNHAHHDEFQYARHSVRRVHFSL